MPSQKISARQFLNPPSSDRFKFPHHDTNGKKMGRAASFKAAKPKHVAKANFRASEFAQDLVVISDTQPDPGLIVNVFADKSNAAIRQANLSSSRVIA